ncbi:MAG TPA: hypothetical protein VGU27_09235 [Candidatus Eisenbacteria bacterium]|nr:hypothetical protein [Candidatus Eisenbacteria bacterium]
MDSAPDDLAARLTRVERRAARLSALAALLAVGVALAALPAFLPRPTLEAREFRLLGARQSWRGSLMTRPGDDVPILRLNDARERARLLAILRDDGELRLRLADTSGVNRLVLAVDAHGSPSVALAAADGGTRAVLAVDGHGEPFVLLRAGGRERRVSLADAPAGR